MNLVSSEAALDFTKLRIESEDQTQIFYNRYNNILSGLDESELETLKDSIVIVVPGFLGEWLQNIQGYLSPLKIWLNKKAIPYVVVETNSNKTSEENAVKIREQIKTAAKTKKKIYILAHSRGGLDTLLALTENRPQAKISGVILIQSPIYGTWISDAVSKWCQEWKDTFFAETEVAATDCMQKVISLSGGKSKAKEMLAGLWDTILAMKSLERGQWMKAHQDKLYELFHKEGIPLLSIVTKDEGATFRFTPYEVFRRKMWGINISNDGVVPSSSMKVPGTSFVFLQENADHSTLVEKHEQKSFFQSRVLETAFDLVVDGSLSKFSID